MALRINLLDWRAERRERRKRQFFQMLALGGLAGVMIGGGMYLHASGAVEHQRERNQYLTQQVAEIDQKIKEIESLERTRDNLLARMRVIETLQSSRSASVHFFDEVVETLPEGVSLTLLRQQGEQVTIEGVADSNGRVSAYMKNLDASEWFEDPRLVVIRATEAGRGRASEFTLQVKSLTRATASADDEEAEQ
ncbi:PilN domain-containing protein [Polycyclovorans algicola]|uniref:PilN domain-containing protein n=1 Tax=Polycyclovorans algicola TaxID=616992 RepID=UPI0004A770AD|nr:PilN domain-containing protein [Polycyclovorans algicola]